ncbi:glycosyltransferase family 2 protein [Candidatus Saccharibacteria bacterium]|nr:glycosyltransferase family 2 protein [Candidatus Saccharibacteria bacterium]
MSGEKIKRKAKKISVIVPNYNYAKYLKRRILSIGQQIYPVYELIVLDDASTDNSKTVIKRAVAEASRMKPEMRIKLIWNKKNSGKAISQWIKGVEAATGDYIWIAEADDIARKDFLSEVMKGFEKDQDVVLAYSESAIINKYGILMMPNFRKSRDREGTGHFKNSYIRPGKKEIEEIMAIRCTIPNVSAAVFKNTPELHKYLKLAEKFEQVGDWYLYVKLLENGKIFYNKRSLNLFRVHGGSATKRGIEHVRELEKMHEYFKDNYDLSQDVLDSMGVELGRIKQKYGIIK